MDLSIVPSLTAEQITSAELIEEIFSEEDIVFREELITKVQMQAKALGCKMQFDSLVKAQKQQIRETRRDLAQQKNNSQHISEDFTYTYVDEDESLITCNTGKWMVSENGIGFATNNGTVVVSHYPIIISKKLTNRETGEEKLELTWWKDGAKKVIPALRDIISSSTRIVTLSRYGFPATSENSRSIVQYLADYEAFNGTAIPSEISTSKFGWADEEFVPYTDKIILDSGADFKALVESVTMHGDFEVWMRLVKQIRASGRKEPMVYLAASFGSVLLPLLNVQPFIVDLYGISGTGKTVSLMLATSVWANPYGRGYITESTSTVNALEIRLNVLNNLPLMVDDLSKAFDAKKVNLVDLIYNLCAGGGKNRLNRDVKMRFVPTWDCIILTNIERPLTDDTMRGGAVNRVLDFKIEPGDIYADGNAVVTTLTNNYGFAGKVFVDAVRALGAEKIHSRVEHYKQEIKEQAILMGEQKEDKQITPLAVLLTADEITEKIIFKDGMRLNMEYCMNSIKSKTQVSELERAYQHFVDAYFINRIKFDPDNVGEVWGKKMEGDYVAVIPSALEKIAEQYNFSKKQFIDWCGEAGLLESDAGRNDKKVSFNGSDYAKPERKRCHVIYIGDAYRVQKQDDDFIKGDVDDVYEDIPFEMPGEIQ